MRRLRDPVTGCPWDRAQSFASLVSHTLEEAYEVADCIERDDWPSLQGELGDLLFQIVFYTQLATEAGAFSFNDVVESVVEKLIDRHPHVFGAASVRDAAHQAALWEARKAAERAISDPHDPSVLANVPLALPALTRAAKLQKRAATVGFDWPDVAGVVAKVHEEMLELNAAIEAGAEDDVADEMGDLLFACVNWARHLGVDPESCMRAANRKFERRFRYVETELNADGRVPADTPLDIMEQLWAAAKREDG